MFEFLTYSLNRFHLTIPLFLQQEIETFITLHIHSHTLNRTLSLEKFYVYVTHDWVKIISRVEHTITQSFQRKEANDLLVSSEKRKLRQLKDSSGLSIRIFEWEPSTRDRHRTDAHPMLHFQSSGNRLNAWQAFKSKKKRRAMSDEIRLNRTAKRYVESYSLDGRKWLNFSTSSVIGSTCAQTELYSNTNLIFRPWILHIKTIKMAHKYIPCLILFSSYI